MLHGSSTARANPAFFYFSDSREHAFFDGRTVGTASQVEKSPRQLEERNTGEFTVSSLLVQLEVPEGKPGKIPKIIFPGIEVVRPSLATDDWAFLEQLHSLFGTELLEGRHLCDLSTIAARPLYNFVVFFAPPEMANRTVELFARSGIVDSVTAPQAARDFEPGLSHFEEGTIDFDKVECYTVIVRPPSCPAVILAGG